MRNLPKDMWPTKGQTKDSGAGSRAKVALEGMDDGQEAQALDAYAKVIKVLDGLPENVQRCVGFAAASDFTFDAISAKAHEAPTVTVKKVGEEAGERTKAEVGSKKLSVAEYMAIYEKHVKAVKAERKAKRDGETAETTETANANG